MMEIRLLRYFLAVAGEENITKAAALLHVTQPTLSRQLMLLEKEPGAKLFRRSQYRIVLTFIPLSPKPETGTVLTRKKDQIHSPAADQFLRFIRNEVGISVFSK